MQPLIRVWKLEGEEDRDKLEEENLCKAGGGMFLSHIGILYIFVCVFVFVFVCDCVCVCVCVLPLGKYSAEVVQDGVELHLQIIEDVSCLCVQLQQTHKRTVDR